MTEFDRITRQNLKAIAKLGWTLSTMNTGGFVMARKLDTHMEKEYADSLASMCAYIAGRMYDNKALQFDTFQNPYGEG